MMGQKMNLMPLPLVGHFDKIMWQKKPYIESHFHKYTILKKISGYTAL